jgi:tRNA G18 (ribose-2'-O)-methylase SpoU
LYKVTDPHNTGAIIRSALAFNIKNILITKHNSSKENETVARVSSGAIDGVDIYIINNLDSTLKIFSKKGWFIIGLDGSAQEDIKNLEKWKLNKKNLNFRK